MHSTNYTDTLILRSPDCPVLSPPVPHKAGTIATLQHERLAAAPYRLTSDELIFGVHADRRGLDAAERGGEREVFFATGQAWLRSSPLVKTYGWALHHDNGGRVAQVDPGSERFRQLSADRDVTKLAGTRSSRA